MEFKNKVAIRRLADRTAKVNKKGIRDLLRYELIPCESLRYAFLCDVVQRHVLLTCPEAQYGKTCADLTVRFLKAAGLWGVDNTTQCSSCTSVSDLFWNDDVGPKREPAFRPRLKFYIEKTRKLGASPSLF